MNILSIEASTESCSAAFYTDDQIFVRHQIAPREHSKLLLNMVDELLKEAKINIQEVDAFAYGMGPGSFTGLRIAASIVQGLAFGTNKKIIPISTLQALAQAAWRRFGFPQIFAALDARMQEIYFGFYELDNNDIMQKVIPEQLSSPTFFVDLPAKILTETWHGVGAGVVAYREILTQSLPGVVIGDPLLYPSALEIVILASKVYLEQGGKPAEEAIPVYLRNKITEKQATVTQGKIIKK
jgi:tRNA threonylcarbamoyladenosine biosynthesis protein TsaB